jgi:Flp pilus assembly pilin Flp
MKELLRQMWLQDEGEDIAEYAVMLAVILVIVVGTIRLIGSQANNVFSETARAPAICFEADPNIAANGHLLVAPLPLEIRVPGPLGRVRYGQ